MTDEGEKPFICVILCDVWEQNQRIGRGQQLYIDWVQESSSGESMETRARNSTQRMMSGRPSSVTRQHDSRDRQRPHPGTARVTR
jgi:hypothetical protein